MSDDIGATVRQWTDVVRRARLDGTVKSVGSRSHTIKGTTVKAVALTLASYADSSGGRVFPGAARVAADCEISYQLAKRCIAGLRELGLIELMRRAKRRGPRRSRDFADEYRLTIPADLLERLEVPGPAAYQVLVGRVAEPSRSTNSGVGNQPSETDDPGLDFPPSEPDPGPGSRARFPTSTDVSRGGKSTPQIVTRSTSHSRNDQSAAVTVSRTREAAKNPDSDDGQTSDPGPPLLRLIEGNPTARLPDVIAHGLWPAAVPDEPRAAVTTGNGFCVDCYGRGQITLATDPIAGSACNYHLAREAS